MALFGPVRVELVVSRGYGLRLDANLAAPGQVLLSRSSSGDDRALKFEQGHWRLQTYLGKG